MTDLERPQRSDVTDLVLVGGGHAHVQVLKAFAMDPPPSLRTTVVLDTPVAVYSGMVPGFVAGQYRKEELEIDVLPLARMAGARVVMARATGIDPHLRSLELEGRPPITYDLVSLDFGSSVAGLDTPGVSEHALATRPIGRFVQEVEARLQARKSSTTAPRVVVVGGGAGGVELAFAIRERLAKETPYAQVTLLEASGSILSGYPERLVQLTLEEAESRGIRVLTGARVLAVTDAEVELADKRLPHDVTVWVAGAAPNPGFDSSGLPTDDRGFIQTRATLQVNGLDSAFAVGDCATLMDHSWVPKAGVYAVRQGPVLTDNLRRAARGSSLRRYRPQRDFLTLLNLGDDTALGAKWNRSFSGKWVLRLKDRIDRRFMERFQALSADARVSPAFERVAAMRANMDVLCGGCAAKLGQSELARALTRLNSNNAQAAAPSGLVASRAVAARRDLTVRLGMAEGDDAAAYAAPGGSWVVSSVDQFRGFTDDPFLVGKVGAVNAASDVLAKGVDPVVAQALVALPESAGGPEREELLFQVLAGATQAFQEMGVTLVGGHTTTGSELLVGFHVEGFIADDEALLAIDRGAPGQTLILTKGLGTGVLFHGDMRGRLRGPWFQSAVASMVQSNAAAVAIATQAGATATTDVTGFGLAQHVASMVRASGLSAEIDVGALPALPGARELLDAGLRSTFHDENASNHKGILIEDGAEAHSLYPLLFDPQTSGGLVFGVAPNRAVETVSALRNAGYGRATAIGRTFEAGQTPLSVVVGTR